MHTRDINTVNFKSGAHTTREQGMCAMEAAAWLAGEPHSDRPACVCVAITRFMSAWNDSILDGDARNRLLRPLIPIVLNTASTSEVASKRAWMMFDWFVRTFIPAWLKPLPAHVEQASALETLPPIVDAASVSADARQLLTAISKIPYGADVFLCHTHISIRGATYVLRLLDGRDRSALARYLDRPEGYEDASVIFPCIVGSIVGLAPNSQVRPHPVAVAMQASAAELVKRMCQLK